MAASSTCTRPPATVLHTDGSRRSTVDEFVACALETKPESPRHRHRLVLHRLGRRRSAADTTASAPPRPPRVFYAGVQEPDATVDDDPYYTGGAYYYVLPADDDQE
ncbi:uncharacterized protein [Triticum aestivum]|uniref:uncharacterized protein isoform X2 n=1 Tax=Triticum aestivum TaxID=4565 RepID=UPI001D012A56|nr:uncharacterized protein LOC123083262 isoform X2 [Triticum aestivum]